METRRKGATKRVMNPMPRVFITRWIPEEAMAVISPHAEVRQWPEQSVPAPRELLLEEAESADGLLTLLQDRIDEELLARASKLKVVSNCAVGYDNIDVPACATHGVAVGNTPGVLTETTADMAWALMMAAARRVVEGDRIVRDGRWSGWHLMYMVGQDVFGATLGIVGMGRIGSAVARRAAGFGMRVIYHSRSEAADAMPGARRVDMDELLEQSDFISVHVPASPETRHMFGAKEFSKMKPNCVFVNTARGSIVDQQALADALRSRTIYAAGLDVFEKEPLPPDDPLIGLDNVVLAPHMGSGSERTRKAMARIAAENLVAGIQGEPLPFPVYDA